VGQRLVARRLKLRRVPALGQATLMLPVRLVPPAGPLWALVWAQLVRRREPGQELARARRERRLVRPLQPGPMSVLLPVPVQMSVRQIGWGERPHEGQPCPMMRGRRRPCSATQLACY
jgi:hypothetical protein